MTKGEVVKKIRKKIAKGVVMILDKTLSLEANSASCFITYEPKTPEKLKRYRRIK